MFLLRFIDEFHVLLREATGSPSSTPTERVSREKNMSEEQKQKVAAMQKPSEMDASVTHPQICVLLPVALGIYII